MPGPFNSPRLTRCATRLCYPFRMRQRRFADSMHETDSSSGFAVSGPARVSASTVTSSTPGRTLIALVIFGLGVGISGCGYRPLVGPGSHLRAASQDGSVSPATEVSRLAVMAFESESAEPWLGRIVSDSMRREMGARGTLRLVNDPRSADLILHGRIRSLSSTSRSFSSFVAALEYSVTIALDVEVVRATGDVVRLDSLPLTETETYLASADIETTRSQRLEALRKLSEILASRVADTIEVMEHPLVGPEADTPIDPRTDAGAAGEGA